MKKFNEINFEELAKTYCWCGKSGNEIKKFTKSKREWSGECTCGTKITLILPEKGTK